MKLVNGFRVGDEVNVPIYYDRDTYLGTHLAEVVEVAGQHVIVVLSGDDEHRPYKASDVTLVHREEGE